MIKLIDIEGRAHYVSPANIARVTEPGASSQWHGIRSIVRLFDGDVIEAQQSAAEVIAAVSAHSDAAKGAR